MHCVGLFTNLEPDLAAELDTLAAQKRNGNMSEKLALSALLARLDSRASALEAGTATVPEHLLLFQEGEDDAVGMGCPPERLLRTPPPAP